VHLTLLPYLRASGELKTKPTQHSVGKLREIGIQPHVLICRSERDVPEDMRQKIALFCNVDLDSCFIEKDVDHTIYEIPLVLRDQGLDRCVLNHLDIDSRGADFSEWESFVETLKHPKKTFEIALVGKYIELNDAYKSIYEAITHGAAANKVGVKVRKIGSEEVEEKSPERLLEGVHGVIVAGGFGTRGVEGKIQAARYARESRLPYLGLCLGMQIAAIEAARHLCGLTKANSTEFDPGTPDPVISLLEEQQRVEDKGGTMRLGSYPCAVQKGSKAYEAYGSMEVQERHRHRFEFNDKYRDRFREKGVVFSGLSPNGKLVEILELKDHPFFLGTQFHPEFRSRPTQAHPLFRAFIGAALKHYEGQR
jgi:CTP synthase